MSAMAVRSRRVAPRTSTGATLHRQRDPGPGQIRLAPATAGYAPCMRWWLAALIFVAACATNDGRELGLDGGPDNTLPAPTTELAAEERPWVEFEAEWLCDVERSSYADLAELDDALAAKLTERQIDAGEYEAFKQRVRDDRELALHVQAAVVERCG